MNPTVEIRKEIDGDYGPILRVYIDGKYTHHCVMQNAPDPEVHILKCVIAEQSLALERYRKRMGFIADFRSSLKRFLESNS